MNKSMLATALAALCAAAAFTTPVLAQTTSTQSTRPVVATLPAASRSKTKIERPVPAPGSRQCIRATGSHIPPPKGQCLSVAGSSYSQQDIQRTGATNVGQALQMLDPSVTVRGH